MHPGKNEYDRERLEDLSMWLFQMDSELVNYRRDGRKWDDIYCAISGFHGVGDYEYARYRDEVDKRLNEQYHRARLEKEEERRKEDEEKRKYEFVDVQSDEERFSQQDKQNLKESVAKFDAKIKNRAEASTSRGEAEQFGCRSKRGRVGSTLASNSDVNFESDWSDEEEEERMKRLDLLKRKPKSVMIPDLQNVTLVSKNAPIALSPRKIINEQDIVWSRVKDLEDVPVESTMVVNPFAKSVPSVKSVDVSVAESLPSRSEDLKLKSFYEVQLEQIIEEMRTKFKIEGEKEQFRLKTQFEAQMQIDKDEMLQQFREQTEVERQRSENEKRELRFQLTQAINDFKIQYRTEVLVELRNEARIRQDEIADRRLMEQQLEAQQQLRNRLNQYRGPQRPIEQREIIDYESNVTDTMTDNQINQLEGKCCFDYFSFEF